MPNRSLSFCALLIAGLFLLSGCIATKRSNTRIFDEEMQVRVLQYEPESPEQKAMIPPLAAAAILELLKLAVNWEASKYSDHADTTAGPFSFGTKDNPLQHVDYRVSHADRKDAYVPFGHYELNPERPLYLTVTRTILKPNRNFWEKLWAGITFFDNPGVVDHYDPAELETMLATCEPLLTQKQKDYLLPFSATISDPNREDKQRYLGLMAFFKIAPAQEHALTRLDKEHHDSKTNLQIELLGYQYSALKAKNLAFPIPFTDYDHTDSVLKLHLEGPAGDIRFAGNPYTFTSDFKLDWPRKADKVNWTGCGKDDKKPLKISPPFRLWSADGFQVQAFLLESSDLATDLKKANDLIGKIKIK